MKPLAVIRSHDGFSGLEKALRARWLSLGIPGETLDEVSGLTARYAAKLLAPFPEKHLGHTSLGPLLGALGLMLIVVEDEEMIARLAKRFGGRPIRTPNASASMLPVKRRKKRRSMWKGSTEWATLMNARRSLTLSDRDRAIIAKTAAAARWRKARVAALHGPSLVRS